MNGTGISMGNGARVVISVMGRNRVGILATVAKVLADKGVDIADITQKIVDGLFLMMIVADLPGEGSSLEELNEALQGPCRRLGLQVIAQHEKLFKYMHRV